VDPASWGIAHICSLASQAGQSVLLSGSGADETITDYGFAGKRLAPSSQWGGFWPNDTTLAAFFPWKPFQESTQRNYLAKDEYVTGTYGVEGRFPVLDAEVVQATISLTPKLKNTLYKAPIQLFFQRHDYPHAPCEATASQPFGEGWGCQKRGFGMYAGIRNVAAKTRLAAQATKALQSFLRESLGNSAVQGRAIRKLDTQHQNQAQAIRPAHVTPHAHAPARGKVHIL